MAVLTGSGLFSTLMSNQAKLNSRKEKGFLWKGTTRRFKNKNLHLEDKHWSKQQKQRFINRLKKENGYERERELFSLTITVLLCALLMAIFF